MAQEMQTQPTAQTTGQPVPATGAQKPIAGEGKKGSKWLMWLLVILVVVVVGIVAWFWIF